MKKIIDGRRYDTETAKAVGKYRNNVGEGDLDYISEVLYLKRTGEFFLHGEGGARTKYAESIGGCSWSSGEEIIPLTLEEAHEWVESHLSGDNYEKIFGVVDEDAEGTMVGLRLPESAIKKLQNEAKWNKKSMDDIVAELIEGLPSRTLIEMLDEIKNEKATLSLV